MRKQYRSGKQARKYKRRLKRQKKHSRAVVDKLIEQLSTKRPLVVPLADTHTGAHHDGAEIFVLSFKDIDPFHNPCGQESLGRTTFPFLKRAFNTVEHNKTTFWYLTQKTPLLPLPTVRASVALKVSQPSVRQVSKRSSLLIRSIMWNSLQHLAIQRRWPLAVGGKAAPPPINFRLPTVTAAIMKKKPRLDSSTTNLSYKEPIFLPIPNPNWDPITIPNTANVRVLSARIYHCHRTIVLFTIPVVGRLGIPVIPTTEQSSSQRRDAKKEVLQGAEVDVDSDAETDLYIEQLYEVSELDKDEGFCSGSEDGTISELMDSSVTANTKYLIERMSAHCEYSEVAAHSPKIRRAVSCPLISSLFNKHFYG